MNVRLLIMKLQPAAGQKQLARTLQRAVGEDGLQCCSDESGELLGGPICCYFMGDSCSICRPQLLSTESKLLPSQLVKFLQPSERQQDRSVDKSAASDWSGAITHGRPRRSPRINHVQMIPGRCKITTHTSAHVRAVSSVLLSRGH